jgi:hypothetical protein
MEIKTLGAMPLWLSHLLCEGGMFPRAFSKYGIWYTDVFLRALWQERKVMASA